MKNPEISLFFPAFNEEKNILTAVRKAGDVLKAITSRYEIIIVDDGSRDRTGQIADSLAADDPHVSVVHHQSNQGYGAALWSGIQAAKYDWVFFSDADLQFNLEEISKLLQYIQEYKVVIGYRSPRKDSFLRIMNGKGWNFLVRLFFGLKVRDVDCAFKLFDRRLLARLPLQTRGATMSAELMICLMRLGVKWKEVPVTHLPRLAGRPTGAKPSVIIRAFRELFQLYWKGI